VFACPAPRIAAIRPLLTMVGGAVAHADQELAASLPSSASRSVRSTSDTSA